MRFVGGRQQAEFVARVRGKDPARCLMVPIDVGKRAAAALVADLATGCVRQRPQTWVVTTHYLRGPQA